MSSSEIRAEARKSLQGNWGKGALIILVYFLFSMLVSWLLENTGSLAFLLNIAYLIISVPIAFGLMISMMKLKRSENVGPFDFLKEGFANFKRSWTIAGNMIKKLIVYFIIVLVGAFILGFSAGLGITSAVFGSSSAGAFTMGAMIGLFMYLAGLILMIPKSLLYVLAMYIGFDEPNMSSKEAVEKSAELMMGNRWKYFCLCFSFIGWAILSVFTLGIGYFWLMPYMSVSFVVFYEARTGKLNSNPVEVKETENNSEPIQ